MGKVDFSSLYKIVVLKPLAATMCQMLVIIDVRLVFKYASARLSMFVKFIRLDLGRRKKTSLNFYFHTSFWCLNRFYEDLSGFRKTF